MVMGTNMASRIARIIALICITTTAPLSAAVAGPWRHHDGYGHGYNRGYGHHRWHDDTTRFSFNYTQWIETEPVYVPYPPPSYNTNYTPTSYTPPQTEGRYCREYIRPASVAGRTQQTYGTACLQPDGDWQIVD